MPTETQHVLFYTDNTCSDVVLLLDGHPDNGRVFSASQMLGHDGPTLTSPRCLVPTNYVMTEQALAKSKATYEALPADHYARSDGMCHCPTCFVARTNYPH